MVLHLVIHPRLARKLLAQAVEKLGAAVQAAHFVLVFVRHQFGQIARHRHAQWQGAVHTCALLIGADLLHHFTVALRIAATLVSREEGGFFGDDVV